MNYTYALKKRWRAQAGAFLSAVAVLYACASTAQAADSAPPDPKGATTHAKAKAPKKELTGAELYAVNCNRCHPERYPTEFTASQWKTILTHMRVRANLPAKQARKILKYLQEDAGS